MIVIHYAELLVKYVVGSFALVFLSFHSIFSVASLFSALCVAGTFVLLTRQRHKRTLTYRAMLRALFPSWLYRHTSFRADVGFFLFNILASGVLFGWAGFSVGVVSSSVHRALTASFGAAAVSGSSHVLGRVIATLAVFIAYELAYWFDHYLSHRVPVLWEFHKVHHTAEVLSPLTNFRVHPVDSIVYGNFLALFIGTTDALTQYAGLGTAFGGAVHENLILIAFFWVLGHLQHSHLWISFPGPLGRVILSPAHHQVHHSDNPKHFNKNFGSCLAIWDGLFGTLHLPERNKEDLRFGVGESAAHHHTAVGSLLTPFAAAVKRGSRFESTRSTLPETTPREDLA